MLVILLLDYKPESTEIELQSKYPTQKTEPSQKFNELYMRARVCITTVT